MQNNSANDSFKGTLIYSAPELFDGSEESKSSDVYAFSIICYEMIINEKPFDGLLSFQISHKINEGYRPEFKKPILKSYQNLITSCWSDIKKSADNYYKKAMYKYGLELILGENVKKDVYERVRYLLNAAEGGHKKALHFSSILFKTNKIFPAYKVHLLI